MHLLYLLHTQLGYGLHHRGADLGQYHLDLLGFAVRPTGTPLQHYGLLFALPIINGLL